MTAGLSAVPNDDHPSGVSNEELAFRGAVAKSIKTKRTSIVQGDDSGYMNPLSSIYSQYAQLGYQLPWEILDYVELLSIYNPDYSQAVDNIRTLANSGHELFVDGGSRVVAQTKALLEEKSRSIQPSHGGIDGLIDKLLHQAATFGAMCGEWVVNEEMTEVIDFADVNPKSIRFFWEDSHWAPYQKVRGDQAKKAEARGQKVRNGCFIKLNELTFSYYAFDAMPGSPYGTPPFIACLRNIAIQNDMLDNMGQIVKKVGLLGIIDLVIKQLPRIAGETPEQYEARAGAYLDDYAKVTEDMVRDGGLVHFDDVEAKTYNITGNAAGATNIFKQNEELIFSGLKSMPSVQGRSYSTTETYAGVAYDIIIRNTEKYQRACKRMIESGYWLIAGMSGLNPDKITLNFNSNKTLQRLQDAQAETIEIRNAAMKWLAGIIDQNGFAQELGYSSPKREMEEPPPGLIGSAKNNQAAPDTSSGGNLNNNENDAGSGEGES